MKFDSRAPEPEGDGFFALAVGEKVLVFADSFEPAYPRELFHGAPKVLAAEIKTLRDFVNTMDAPTMALHGLTPATRTSQVRLYDEALGLLTKAGSPARAAQPRASGQSQGHSERLVESAQAHGSEAGDIVGQHRLRQADQSIAVDAGIMLEAVFNAHFDLRRQTVAAGVDGGADHGREQRVDQRLAAHDDEDSRTLRVSPARVPDAEEIAPLQTSAW